MDSIEKEARIRICMEKLRKEEEEKKKIRLEQEQAYLISEAEKARKEIEIKAQEEIMKVSKQRIFNEKMRSYIKERNWSKIVELINDTLFEHKCERRITNDENHYQKMNEFVANALSEEYKHNHYYNYDYTRNIILTQYGIIGGYNEISQYLKGYVKTEKNNYLSLREFETIVKDLLCPGYTNIYLGGIYYESLYELKNMIRDFVTKRYFDYY